MHLKELAAGPTEAAGPPEAAGPLPTGCTLLATATVEPGSVWTGCLAPWSRAAREQRRYWGDALDAYTLNLVTVTPLTSPLHATLRRTLTGGAAPIVSDSHGAVVFQPVDITAADGAAPPLEAGS